MPRTIQKKVIQTFYTIAERNHIQLGGITDRKSTMILAVCTGMISAVLSGSAKIFKGDLDYYTLIPIGIFLLFMVATMICSIITKMPKLSNNTYNKDAVKEYKVNLAFFGNFHKMDLENYEWAMKYMRNDNVEIY